MELTESLKNEFIFSLQRLSDSINNVIDTECYDYLQVSEIHKTYIEYCKAFQSIDVFSEVPLNVNIKFPKQINKFFWSGKASEKEVFLFGKYTRRNYSFEKKAKEMFEKIKPNLQLIYHYLKNPKANLNDTYVKKLTELINSKI